MAYSRARFEARSRSGWIARFGWYPLLAKKGETPVVSLGSVVVGELSQRKQFGPVVLLVAAVGAEVLLEGLIDPLGLTIPFRMISRGEVEFHVERCAEAVEEMSDKLRAAVRCDVPGYPVL